jgi:diguanylate cyclase (GGDEF)-like protein
LARVSVAVIWGTLLPLLITKEIKGGPGALLRADSLLEVACCVLFAPLLFAPARLLPYLQVLLFMAAPLIDFLLILLSPAQTGRISTAIGLTIVPVIAFMMWGRRLGVLATLFALVIVGILGATGLIPGQVTLILFTAVGSSGLLLGWTAHTTERLEFDPLTGLANRRGLERFLARTLSDTDTAAAACSLAVLDVDGVRHHNETRGRRTVDDLLHRVGSTLTDRLQDRAQVFHLGAGEFAVLLVGDRREAVEQLAILQQAPAAGVTLCAGMSAVVVPTTAARLLNQAEASLARAKAAGPDAMDLLVVDDVLVHELRDAVSNGQLTVLYQPIFDLATNATVGCEALVRWDHPTRGRIGPDRFIPLAEEAGLIHDLGRFVLRQACAQAAAATAEGRQLCHLSVNVSALELQRPDYADDVLQALAETGLDPRRLVLEVTESSVAGQDLGVASTLARLRRGGVRVAIDDFGTGYSSLSQLGHLPVDILKIDKSFIWAEATPLRDSVLTAIMGLATAFRLTTIAEGIETWDHLDLMHGIGCTFGQGYLVGRPSAFSDLDLAATEAGHRQQAQYREEAADPLLPGGSG